MDGTFTKSAVQQCILTAVIVDADNHAAWGIVESESGASWRMFLSKIKIAIPEIIEPYAPEVPTAVATAGKRATPLPAALSA
jgi:hypothetical protein